MKNVVLGFIGLAIGMGCVILMERLRGNPVDPVLYWFAVCTLVGYLLGVWTSRSSCREATCD